jgi:hypothetical protein
LKSVNGISKECKIYFHDARPDYSLQSSDYRMEVSSSAAFNHINTYIHPQASIIDLSGEEEAWFLKGIKDRASTLGRTIIELPKNAEQNLMWITLLDSASLSGRYLLCLRNIANLFQPGIRSLLILSSMLSRRHLDR